MTTNTMKRSLTVICHYNGKEMLADCLKALKGELGKNDDVLVVDNGSSDGSADFVAKEFSWVKLLALKENLGFAGGNNQALKFAPEYEYFVLLNNDCQVEPGFYDALLTLFANESVGITNAVILNGDGKTVDHAGGKWLNFLSGTNIGGFSGALPKDLPSEPFDTTYASGAALAIRTDLLKNHGLFPDFFMYYEDVDLSWRMHNLGYRIVVTPKARVKHLGSATSKKNRAFVEFFAARNRIWVFRRNLSAWQKPLVLPILVLARILLLLPSIGHWDILQARFKGLIAGILDSAPQSVSVKSASISGSAV